MELQSVDPDSAQEIYLANNRNPRRLWKLAKSTLRGVLAVVGVRVTITLVIGLVSCAAPVLVLLLHSLMTGLLVTKRCSDGHPLSGREQQRLQQQLREMLNYDRGQLNGSTEVAALLLHCFAFLRLWVDDKERLWYDTMAIFGAITFGAELVTWVSLPSARGANFFRSNFCHGGGCPICASLGKPTCLPGGGPAATRDGVSFPASAPAPWNPIQFRRGLALIDPRSMMRAGRAGDTPAELAAEGPSLLYPFICPYQHASAAQVCSRFAVSLGVAA